MSESRDVQRIASELVREDPSCADLVEEFLAGLATRLKSMETAIRDADLTTLRTAAHQLKGSGGGYGYPELTRLAAELEQVAKAGALDACRQRFGQVADLCTRLVVRE